MRGAEYPVLKAPSNKAQGSTDMPLGLGRILNVLLNIFVFGLDGGFGLNSKANVPPAFCLRMSRGLLNITFGAFLA